MNNPVSLVYPLGCVGVMAAETYPPFATTQAQSQTRSILITHPLGSCLSMQTLHSLEARHSRTHQRSSIY